MHEYAIRYVHVCKYFIVIVKQYDKQYACVCECENVIIV